MEIKLPKMKVETSLDLVDVLQKLGLNDVFSLNADLSGICKDPERPLALSRASHKALIEVNKYI